MKPTTNAWRQFDVRQKILFYNKAVVESMGSSVKVEDAFPLPIGVKSWLELFNTKLYDLVESLVEYRPHKRIQCIKKICVGDKVLIPLGNNLVLHYCAGITQTKYRKVLTMSQAKNILAKSK